MGKFVDSGGKITDEGWKVLSELIEEREREQARGKKESRGEKINRLLKDKPGCEWGPGGV